MSPLALVGMLPKWSKFLIVGLAGAAFVIGIFWMGVRYQAAQCREAELARQLAVERENLRIAQESAQVAEGFRIRAEREAASLRDASRRREAVEWDCGDVQLPQIFIDEIR